MRILIDEVLLFTGERFFPDACVQIEDATISYAGPSKDAPFFVADRIIDGQGKLAMPGLVNAHTHLPMTLMRGLGSERPLQEWLGKYMLPLEAHLTPEAVAAGTRLAVMECLKSGVTCVADLYHFEDTVAQVLAQSGMRALVARSMTHAEDSAQIEEATDLYKNWHKQAQGRIRVCVGIHAEYTGSDASIWAQKELADKLSVPIHLHLSETEQEVMTCRQRHEGLTPVQYFDRIGVLERPVIAAHCVHVDAYDLDILASRGVSVVHNPISNLKLGSGVMPLLPMLDRGIRVALGTDGAASNNNLSLWEEIKLTAILHKGLSRNATVVPPPVVLAMAGLNGGAALGWRHVGLLREGWHADITLLHLGDAHWVPNFDPMAQLVYAAQSSDVYLTMVDGNILYEYGEFNTLDEERTRAEAMAAAEDLVARAGKAAKK